MTASTIRDRLNSFKKLSVHFIVVGIYRIIILIFFVVLYISCTYTSVCCSLFDNDSLKFTLRPFTRHGCVVLDRVPEL